MRLPTFWLLMILSLFNYLLLALMPRTEFWSMFGLVSMLFLFFYATWMLRFRINLVENMGQVMLAGILLRFLLIFFLPNLSDDYFRFLWDGHLVASGENPYLHLPEEWMQGKKNDFSNVLYEGMNSRAYYSVYPPLNQLLFTLSSVLFPENIAFQVAFLKVVLFISEIGSILLLPKLMKALSLKKELSFFYILNPLVILEGVGNLHFECLSIFFLSLTIYSLIKNKERISAVFFGCAAGIKFIPLIAIPFLIKYLSPRKIPSYLLITFLVFAMPFALFIQPSIFQNIFSSVELYFQSFEFNASIYYMIRYLGFQLVGYNIIQMVGIFLSSTILIFTLCRAYVQKRNDPGELLNALFYSLLVYYLLSTTLHPWYLINLLFLSLFTRHVLSVSFWTFSVFLSYSAYSNPGYQENHSLIMLEYLTFFVLFLMEWRGRLSHKIALPIR